MGRGTGYIARITVNGITVSSRQGLFCMHLLKRCTRSFEDADQLRRQLADLHTTLEDRLSSRLTVSLIFDMDT